MKGGFRGNQWNPLDPPLDYQEDLEKSRADSEARSHDSYMKDPEKSRARNRESYKKDLKKNRDDSAAHSHESYLKDREKSLAWNRESYMKDPERDVLTVQYEAAKVNKKDFEKNRWNETGLAVSYKSKNTATA